MEFDPDLLMRGGQIAVSAVVGFAGGLLAGERQDRRALRSLEAVLFAAGSLRRICQNLVGSADPTRSREPAIAAAWVDDRGVEVIRGVLVHVRAVDLPETVSIDVLARVNLTLTRTENVLRRVSQGAHGSFVSDLQDQIDDLDPIIADLTREMNRLERFWLLKLAAKLNPLRWFGRGRRR